MNLKTLVWHKDEMTRAFGGAEVDLEDAKPGALEADVMGMYFRAYLTERRLENAAFFLEAFEKCKKGRIEQAHYWNAFILTLGGIQDLVLVEMAHYACVFYPLMRDPKMQKLLKDPNPSFSNVLREKIKQACPNLFQEYDDHLGHLKDFKAMRNFIAHNGGLYPHMIMIAGADASRYGGYMGADIYGNRQLRVAGFFLYADTKHATEVSQAVDWYNRVVGMVQEVRQAAVDFAPLFDPDIHKFSSPHGFFDQEAREDVRPEEL